MKKYLLLISGLFLFCSFLQNSGINPIIILDNETITVVFAGDIMGHSPQYRAAYNPITKTYNYNTCFRSIKKYIESADLAVANLEVPIAGKPYSGYPNFSSPDALLDGLKYAGYDLLLTANNHALDRSKFGLERTIRQIEKRNLLHTGTFANQSQRDSVYPLIVTIKGVKLAFLNYTYGTNNILTNESDMVNCIDSQQIITDIEKADKFGADLKIMTIHWGTEYELQANDSQRRLAQFFANQGINLIIGSHPHVVQNAEILYNKDNLPVPVFYSLGNSLSNQREVNTNGGVIVQVEIDTKLKTIRNTSFLPVYVHKGVLNGKYQYHLIPTVDFISNHNRYPLNQPDSISLMNFHFQTNKRLSNIQ